MARKRNSESELGVSSGTGAAPVRHKTASARAKRTAGAVTEPASVELPSPTAVAPSVAPAAYQPTGEEIARLAYSYWEARGCQGGSAEEDWLRAERELCGTAKVVVASA
jgi:hypothetical protein